jgi:ProQ/FINO family
MATLSATDGMRDRLVTLGQIGLVKRPRAAKAELAPVKAAAPPAKPAQSGLSRQAVHAIHRQQTEIVIADLRRLFPVVFCDPPVPFAIGFREQIRAATRTIISDRALRRAIGWWIDQAAYQQALAAGQIRHNLDGSASDCPTAQQIALARERLGMPPAPRPRPVLLPAEQRGRVKPR